MTPFDIVVLVVVGLSALFALSRGFVTELLSLLGWIGAFIGLRLFFGPVSAWMRGQISSAAGADILTLLLLFFGLLMLFRFVAGFLGDKVKRTSVGIVDRILGAAFGAVRGVLIVSLAYAGLMLLVGGRDHMPDWVQGSKSEPLIAFGADTVTSFARTVRGNRAKPEADATDAAPPESPFGGYAPEQRQELDTETERLIRESEKQNGGTSI
jgi:membrane protein required for colicin V production